MSGRASEDPRQLRSRLALTDALLRLLRDDALTSISVAGLCKEAGVHRTTFYGHAGSIEEFAVDVLTRELDEVITVDPEEVERTDDSERDPFMPYHLAMIDLLVHVAEKRDVYRVLLNSQWGGTLRVVLDERLRHHVRVALDVFASREGVPVPDHRDETVAFISGGLVGAIVSWARSDETDVKAWAARVEALMPPWWPLH